MDTHSERTPLALCDFCPACGAVFHQQPPAFCPACRTTLSGPSSQSNGLLGATVTFRNNLGRRSGLVIEASDEHVVVMSDSEIRNLPRKKVGRVEREAGPSAAYRLFEAGLTGEATGLLTTVEVRRAFAQAALGVGDVAALNSSGLTGSEVQWLTMWHAHNHSAHETAVRLAVGLPAGTYPDRFVPIVASHEWWRDNANAVEWVRWAASTLRGYPLAELLLQVTGGGAERSIAARAAVALARGSFQGASSDGPLGPDVCTQALGGNHEALLQAAAKVPEAVGIRSWAVLSARPGDPLPPLAGLPIELVDEAVERRIVDAAAVARMRQQGSLPKELDVYLTARTDPGVLTDQQATAIGAEGELVRRGLKAPADTAAGGQRQALLGRLQQGDYRAVGDLMPLLPPHKAATAAALGRSLHSGSIEPAAVSDVSTWPTLAPLVERADIYSFGDPAVRDAAGWILLDAAQRHLFDMRWNEAEMTAAKCLVVVDDEPRCDEALAIRGAAAWMNHRDDVAVESFRSAAEGVAEDSLLVNLALVTTESSPPERLDALERLLRQTNDEGIKVEAGAAAALLHHDLRPDRPLPPPTLNALKKAAVATTTLEQHARVLAALQHYAEEWLAQPRNTSASPHSDEPVHKVAVAKAIGYEELVKAVAAGLRTTPDDPTFAKERDSICDLLIGAMVEDDSAPWAAYFAEMVVACQMPLSDWHGAALRVLAVRERLFELGQMGDGSRPLEEWRTEVANARRLLRTADTDEDGRSGITSMADLCDEWWERLSLDASAQVTQHLLDAFNSWIEAYNTGLNNVYNDIQLYQLSNEVTQHLQALSPMVNEELGNVRAVLRRTTNLEVRDFGHVIEVDLVNLLERTRTGIV